jgi:glutathione peroxidase
MIAKLLLLLTFLAGLPSVTSLYSIHITSINGQDKSMSDFAGKKLLIIVLPVTTTPADSQYLERVGQVSRTYADSVNVIGVPAYEYGFTTASQSAISQRYTSLIGSQVFITSGMYVKLSSAKQHPLFSWLTHSTQNGVFDEEVKGVGQKYFIDSYGQLFGVLSAAFTLRDSLMARLLN